MNRKTKFSAIILSLVSVLLLTSCTKSVSILNASSGDLSTYETIGKTEQPEISRSVSLGKSVLTVWLRDFTEETGISAFVGSEESDSEAETLTAHILLQQEFVPEVKIALLLTGTDLSGENISVRFNKTVKTGHWENVCFSVNSFFSSANLKNGFRVTLLVEEPITEEDTSTLLYFDGITLDHEPQAPAFLWPTVIPFLSAAVGGGAVLWLYFKRKNREVREW